MKPIVVARRCPVDVSDDVIRGRLFDMLDAIDGLAESVGAMSRIAIKSNLGIGECRWHRGHSIALTDPVVVESVVAWLRAETTGELIVGDASTGVRL